MVIVSLMYANDHLQHLRASKQKKECFIFHHRLGRKSCYAHYGMQHHNRNTEKRLCGLLWFVYTVTSVIEWQWQMCWMTELGVVLSEWASVGQVKCVSVDHGVASRNRFEASRGTSLFCHKTGGRSGFSELFQKAPRDAEMIYSSANWRTGRWDGIQRMAIRVDICQKETMER